MDPEFWSPTQPIFPADLACRNDPASPGGGAPQPALSWLASPHWLPSVRVLLILYHSSARKRSVMSESSLHVLIAGGGPGGLCLAQGLRSAGVSVALYERDETPAIRKQGYRIHLDERGASGL